MSGASLVIGSTGLIGKKLIFELAKKDSEVIAIARRPISNLPKNVSLLNINFDDFFEKPFSFNISKGLEARSLLPLARTTS